MFQRIQFFTALFFSFFIIVVNVEAQTHNPKFRSQYNINKRSLFNRSSTPGIALIAGAGLSVMNFENRENNFGNSSLQPLQDNATGLNVNLGVVYMFSPIVGVLGGFDYHDFRAESLSETNDASFKSQAVQASGSLIINLIDGYSGYGGSGRRSFVIPYVKIGLGVAGYKASSSFKDETLSGSKDNPAFAAVVPVGAGLNIQCSRVVSIAPELNFTFTSTDYLDNVVGEAGLIGKRDYFMNTLVKIMYTPDIKSKRLQEKTR